MMFHFLLELAWNLQVAGIKSMTYLAQPIKGNAGK
jgi:hypothetical protein